MHRIKRNFVPWLVLIFLLTAATSGAAIAQSQPSRMPGPTAAPTASPPGARVASPVQIPPLPPSRIVVQKDQGAWRYAAIAEGTDRGQVSIAYDVRNVQSLRAFAQANRDLSKTLNAPGTRLDALITFNRPFTVDEFRKFAADNGLDVKGYTLRATAADGTRITIGGTPSGGDVVPQANLNAQIAGVQQRTPSATLRGVIDATVAFDTAKFDALQATPGVFLVDITRTIATREARAALPQVGANQIIVSQTHPFWAMEDLGLQNFR